jgi:hypothetical protein
MNTSPLRFLADEGCDFGVVRALRAAGYDGLANDSVFSVTVTTDFLLIKG